MRQEHPFAAFIRILGKGKKGSRSLTMAEANTAMTMILEGKTTPEQLGAFLMLIRVKEESPEELAGFIAAARAQIDLPMPRPEIDLDWSSYAGKRRHLPWFILSARLLANHGVRILMHGVHGNKDNRIYCDDAITALGLPQCKDIADIGQAIKTHRLAYIALDHLSPALKRIMDLRNILGLRSPINTLLRMLNPLAAPYLIQGIFHPGYREVHQQAALLLKQAHMVVFKGEGGEAELNPDSPCQLLGVKGDQALIETWPARFARRHPSGMLDVSRIPALWNGEIEDEYARAAVIGTTAIGLYLLDKASDHDTAYDLAETLWNQRRNYSA